MSGGENAPCGISFDPAEAINMLFSSLSEMPL
jgi:hypothetical protein